MIKAKKDIDLEEATVGMKAPVDIVRLIASIDWNVTDLTSLVLVPMIMMNIGRKIAIKKIGKKRDYTSTESKMERALREGTRVLLKKTALNVSEENPIWRKLLKR